MHIIFILLNLHLDVFNVILRCYIVIKLIVNNAQLDVEWELKL
jgi:hypothetical protein